jgi:putative transcriptional regulator
MNLRAIAFVFLLLLSGAPGAQPNGILLVAKPGLADANFSETVVLVTRTGEGNPVGVILNRPTTLHLADVAPKFPGARNFAEALYAGGPVMREVIIALFAADAPPREAAFPVVPGVYLSMHPLNIERVVAAPATRARLYAGFSGWAPSQLEAEIDSGSWYVLRATEDLIFRRDTAGMWAQLVAQARGERTSRDWTTRVAAR